MWIGSLQVAWGQQPVGGGLRAVTRVNTMTREDSLRAQQDSLRGASDKAYVDSLRRNSRLAAPVKYTARDSLIIDRATERMRLYGKATMKFEDKDLASERMTVDQSTNTIQAIGIPDTTDPYATIGRPVFKDGPQEYQTDTIKYNFTTRRGTIVYTRTVQGENVLIATKIRREPEGFFYAAGSRFTTCDNPDHPHYYIRSNRIKFMPNDKIVTGPFQLVVGDVPLPFAFPFGFFPNRFGRNSGILFPTFGDDINRGFNLREGGFYFAPNEYMDFTLRGDIYSNGSWAARLGTRYVWRYRMQGNFLFNYAVNEFGEPEDLDYSKGTDFQVQWAHNQEITPNMRFTASVLAGTSSFDRRATNTLQNVFRNNLNSSIAFTHTLPISGWNYTINATHSQNNQTQRVNLAFPSVTLARTQPIQPFTWISKGLPTWYSTIALNYTARFQNEVEISERNFGKQAMFDSLRNGAVHNLTLGTNFRVLNAITLSPNITYNEFWYFRTSRFARIDEPTTLTPQNIRADGDTLSPEVINGRLFAILRRDVSGFQTARDYSAGINASTRIYGIFRTRWKNQAAFRHTITPTIGYQWRPDFGLPRYGYFDVLANVPGRVPQPFNRFSTGGLAGLLPGVVGSPGSGPSQQVNFGLQNLVEMRYLSSDSLGTKTVIKKSDYKYLNILDDVSLTGSYNLAADSFRLSPLTLTMRTNVLNNLINIQVTSQLQPYQETATGRVDRYRWERFRLTDTRTWSIFRIPATSINISTSLRSPQPKKAEGGGPNGGNTAAPVMGNDSNARRLSPRELYQNSYAPFRLPWTLTLNYFVQVDNFSQQQFEQRLRVNPTDFARRQVTQTLSGNMSLEVGPNWRIGVFTGWDFTRMQMQDPSTFSITRNLHCWEFNMIAVPFGRFRSYNFQINVKTGNLRDLRLQKRRDWRDNPNIF